MKSYFASLSKNIGSVSPKKVFLFGSYKVYPEFSKKSECSFNSVLFTVIMVGIITR